MLIYVPSLLSPTATSLPPILHPWLGLSTGGNCLTAMVATLSVEESNLLETLSTCRFAQRVACISNKARWVPPQPLHCLLTRLYHSVIFSSRTITPSRHHTITPSYLHMCLHHGYLHGACACACACACMRCVRYIHVCSVVSVYLFVCLTERNFILEQLHLFESYYAS